MTTAVQVDRLETLVRYMKDLPDSRFRLDTWTDPQRNTRCAVGLSATSIPEFQALGLSMNRYFLMPDFNGENGMEAAMQFFGLTRAQAVWCFDNRVLFKSRKATLRRIQRTINQAKAERLAEEGGRAWDTSLYHIYG